MKVHTLFLILIFLSGCTSKDRGTQNGSEFPVVVFKERNDVRQIYNESRKQIKSKTIEALRPLCQKENYAACRDLISRLGQKTKDAEKDKVNRKEMVQLRRKWCEKGFFDLCREQMHFLIQNREEFKTEHSRFQKFSQHYCEAKQAKSCELMFMYATNVLREDSLIDEAAEKGCALKDPSMCVKLAYRMAKRDIKRFEQLIDEICQLSTSHCGTLVSTHRDHIFKASILEKLVEGCKQQLQVCEQLARYAMRQSDEGLAMIVLGERCRHDSQRCIELAIMQFQQGEKGYKKTMQDVCKARSQQKRPFSGDFEKFTKKFCHGERITGSAEDWIQFDPRQAKVTN